MAFKDYRDLIRQMEREMQQIHDEAFRGFFTLPAGGSSRFWQPSVDIHETAAGLLIKMELAGTRADDLQVSLSPDDRASAVINWRFISVLSSARWPCQRELHWTVTILPPPTATVSCS
jgi:hypothetical protein